LSKQPFDTAVTAARIAHASIAWTDGRADAARTGMNAALTDWLKNQVLSAPRTDLERDVAAIREAVVRPLGGGIYTTASRWDSFSWPSAPPPFFLVNAEVNVKLSNGAASMVALTAPLPGAPYAVFVTADQLALLNRIMAALGGTKRRQPAHIMEVPNQPAGDSMRILALWKEFFPCQPGHWGGWELVGYPRLTRIEFLDAARTKASAAITIGYSGASVVMEKIDGTWKAIRLTNFWIT
jgi:hypothetical protein